MDSLRGRRGSSRLRLLCALLIISGAIILSSAESYASEVWSRLVGTEKQAERWDRTRRELRAFQKECAWLAPAWKSVHLSHDVLGSVLVFDIRHGQQPGMGALQERLAALLRVSRALKRAGFIWSDDCADHGGPKRSAKGAGGGCQYDQGAYFLSFGAIDWQWSSLNRQKVAERQGPSAARELPLVYECLARAEGRRAGPRAPRDPARCTHARLVFAANGSVAFEGRGDDVGIETMDFLDSLAPHGWLRIETTGPDDFFAEGEMHTTCRSAGLLAPGADLDEDFPCRRNPCEYWANTRPKHGVWREMSPLLRKLDAWDAVASVSVRTGFADLTSDASRFPEISAGAAREFGRADLGSLAGLLEETLRPCPGGASAEPGPGGGVLLPRGEAPCVSWARHEGFVPTAEAAREQCGAGAQAGEALEPGAGLPGPLGAYLECAGRVARALAGGEKWGVFVTSDAPLVKCAAEGATGLGAGGRIASVPAAWGATPALPAHGAYARKAALMAAVEFYLLGLVDFPLSLVGSGFSRAAQIRNLLAREAGARAGGAQPLVGPGASAWAEGGAERLFWGGRPGQRGAAAAVNASTLHLLAGFGRDGREQCPEASYLTLPKELVSRRGGGAAAR